MTINKAIILGRVGRDPEVRYTQGGAAICSLTVATSRKWKDKNSGEQKEETEWHRVSLFDRRAEVAGEYLKKGSLVYIEGRLKTRKWTDKDGVEKYATEILADDMKLIGSRRDEDGGSGYSQPTRAPAPAPRAAAPAPRQSGGGRQDPADFGDDDIPF